MGFPAAINHAAWRSFVPRCEKKKTIPARSATAACSWGPRTILLPRGHACKRPRSPQPGLLLHTSPRFPAKSPNWTPLQEQSGLGVSCEDTCRASNAARCFPKNAPRRTMPRITKTMPRAATKTPLVPSYGSFPADFFLPFFPGPHGSRLYKKTKSGVYGSKRSRIWRNIGQAALNPPNAVYPYFRLG